MDIFEGIRVLDAASFVAAPAAATLLGDLGADVIKVEPPSGDAWRNVTPRERPNSIWHLTSRNKRGIVLDLKSVEQLQILKDMVSQCDVFLHNFRPSQVAEFGIAYEALKPSNPRLIYASMNGLGDKGPEADKRAFDTTAFFGRCGILHMMHDKDQTPPWPVIGLGDHFTAMTLFAGISAALFQREKSGEGCEVTTSLLATGIWGNGVQIQNALGGFDPAGPRDANGWTNPFGAVYQTKDGRFLLFILANRAKEWPKLAAALDLGDLLDDERFNTPRAMFENSATLKSLIADRIREFPLATIARRLDAGMIAWSEIYDHEQIAADPQVLANGIIVPTPADDERLNRSIAVPIRFNRTAHVHRMNAPGLGEHTAEVLAEFGLTADSSNELPKSEPTPLQDSRQDT